MNHFIHIDLDVVADEYVKAHRAQRDMRRSAVQNISVSRCVKFDAWGEILSYWMLRFFAFLRTFLSALIEHFFVMAHYPEGYQPYQSSKNRHCDI